MVKENNHTGVFVAFVLLSECQWDKAKLINDCKADWGIELADNDSDDAMVCTLGDITVAAAFMPAPVPNGEAEHYAAANYMWPEAVDAAKNHKAQIIVSVIGKEAGLIERGKLFTKIVASCLRQDGATAVYTDGAVFHPGFYNDVASLMKKYDDALPILDWVWFGVYRTAEHSGIYTYGMRKFGKEEMEVYADNADLNDMRDFLLNITAYVLDGDVTLNDGETLGFSAEQKLAITISDAIALDGKSIKIEYPR